MITGRQSTAMIVASTSAWFLLAIMEGWPRAAQTCLRKHLQLTESNAQRVENRLSTSVATTMNLVDVSKPTATRAIGILAETTGRRRDRSFAYKAYLDRLRVGTDLDG